MTSLPPLVESAALPPLVEPGADLTREEVARYSRHLIIPDVGVTGQRRLKNSSALLVGAPVWWVSWRPLHRGDPAEVADTGRRVYLVVVFGVSAIVALIALLIIGYRLFEFALDPVTATSVIDRVRAPLGVLVATALVSARIREMSASGTSCSLKWTLWHAETASATPARTSEQSPHACAWSSKAW